VALRTVVGEVHVVPPSVERLVMTAAPGGPFGVLVNAIVEISQVRCFAS
jgi:hypothetical protein